MKKRILLMYWHNFEYKDMGTNIRVNDIVSILNEAGYEIDLYAISGMGYDFTGYEDQSKYITNLYLTDIKKCNNIENIYRNDILNDFVTLEMQNRFNEIIKDREYSYIATIYLAQANLLKFLNLESCKKIYFFEDSMALAENLNGKQLGPCIDDEIRKLKLFDQIVYISSDEKIFYERFCKKQQHFHIPSFFSEKEIKSIEKYDVTFVGHDNKFNIEGIKWFLGKVYPNLNKDIKIRIVGKVSKHIKEDYENITKNYYIENLEEVYSETKLVICPLLNGTGLKIKVLEAMMYGIPVVCTLRGADGFADKNEFGGLVTDNPYEFAKYIEQLLDDKEFYQNKVLDIKKYFVKYLSREINKNKLLDLFNNDNLNIIEKNIQNNGVTVFSIKYKFHELYNNEYGCKIYANGEYVAKLENGKTETTFSIDNNIINRKNYLRFMFKSEETVDGGSGKEETCFFVENIKSSNSLYNIDFKYGSGRYWIRGWHDSNGTGRWNWGNESYISIYKNDLKVSIIAIKDFDKSDEDYHFTLNSILNSDYSNIELVSCYNNGNLDKTSSLMINNYNSIKLEYEYKQNNASIVNKALKLISGDYILIIKSGEAVSKTFITDSIKEIITNDYDYTLSNGMDMSYNNVFGSIKYTNDKSNAIFEQIGNEICSILISYDVINKVGYFNESLKYTSFYDYKLKIILNKSLKGAVIGDIAGFYINDNLYKYSIEYKNEVFMIQKEYNNELNDEEVMILTEFILYGKLVNKTIELFYKMYSSDFYSNENKNYLNKKCEAHGILLDKNIEYIKHENDIIKNDRWYKFGQKSVKEKIIFATKYIIKKINKKYFNIEKTKEIKNINNTNGYKKNNQGVILKSIKENKVLVIYDVTYIALAYNNNTNRTGLFMVCYNVLKGLVNHKDIRVMLYADNENMDKAKKVLKKEGFNLNRLEFINEYDENYFISILKTADIYFSPLFAIPDFIFEYNNIRNMIIIYDLIPYIYPKFFPDMQNDDYWLKQIVKQANNSITYLPISNATKKDFLNYTGIEDKNIKTIYLAVNEYFYKRDVEEIKRVKAKYKIPDNKKYIFSLCTLEPRKNLIFAVKCYIKFIVQYKIDDLYFAMAGSQWDFFINELDNEIKSHKGYKDKILKLGYVDDEDLPALYSGSEFFIYPSLYEGFGLPPLEAMSCGTPVIVSNTSSMPEVCGDAAIYIEPTEEESLIKAMEEIYFNKYKREYMIEKSLENAKKYSWEKTIHDIIDEIRK